MGLGTEESCPSKARPQKRKRKGDAGDSGANRTVTCSGARFSARSSPTPDRSLGPFKHPGRGELITFMEATTIPTTATLTVGGKPVQLPLVVGTEDEHAIDISRLDRKS